mgnify:CR=1 FL=1
MLLGLEMEVRDGFCFTIAPLLLEINGCFFLIWLAPETTEDLKISLNEVECQGACVNAPMMIINGIYYVGGLLYSWAVWLLRIDRYLFMD